MSYRPQQVKPQEGFYAQTKVYYDGSHYIAIPHTERQYRPRRKPVDDSEPLLACILNADKTDESSRQSSENEAQQNSAPAEEADALIGVASNVTLHPSILNSDDKDQLLLQSNDNKAMRCTKKQLFEQLYKENLFLKYRERRDNIIKAMRPYFNDEERTALYIDTNLDRKRRNLIARRIRLTRKANLQNFNYFVTLTHFYGHFYIDFCTIA